MLVTKHKKNIVLLRPPFLLLLTPYLRSEINRAGENTKEM